MGVKCREDRPQVFLEVHSEGTSCSTHQTEEKTSSPGGEEAKHQSRGSEKSTRGHEQCDLLLQLALLCVGVVPDITGPV